MVDGRQTFVLCVQDGSIFYAKSPQISSISTVFGGNGAFWRLDPLDAEDSPAVVGVVIGEDPVANVLLGFLAIRVEQFVRSITFCFLLLLTTLETAAGAARLSDHRLSAYVQVLVSGGTKR